MLVGWIADSTLLKQIGADLPSMKPLVAVGLIALGAALVLLAPSERPGTAHQAGVAFAGFAALIGVAVIAEHLFGGFGIDELLFDDVGPDPGRPSAHTAAGLLLCGLALATLDLDQPRYRVGLVLELLAAAVAVAALIGLAYDVDYLHGRTGSAGVAVHGAIGLALVVLAIALTRPERGIVAFFRGDDPATRLIRRLTPIAILVPPLLGGARLAGERAGLFSAELGVALVALGGILFVVCVIAISAHYLRVQTSRGETSESSFRAVTEASVEAIITADHEGRITYLNPAAERMFGHSSERVSGRDLTLLMPERFRQRHEAGLRRFLDTGETRVIGTTVELVGLRRTGEEFPISLSLVAWEAESETNFTATIRDIGERLAAEQATRELAAIVESSADAVIGWSLDGRVRSWNRGAERVYGYGAEEMVGRTHDVLMPPGEPSELGDLLERIRDGERIENFETSRMRKDRRRIEVSLTVSPILDQDGRVIAASTITRDISNQKAAERKLAESARHFELIGDLVATCGFDGYFKQLNGAWEQTLGWTPEELLPNPFIEIVHADDRAAVEAEVAKQAQGATTAEFKIRVGTKDGGWRWTEWSASPDLPADVFHCVGREISERMEVEQTLAAERRQLATAQKIASVGSWELDLDTGEGKWSAQQFRNLGFSPDGPVPEREEIRERTHPDDRQLFEDFIVKLDAEEQELGIEYRIMLPGGEVRMIQAQGELVIDPDGSRRFMGTSRDVTAERDAERLKDDFFGLVSHELRTPLTSIIGYTELLTEIEAENLSEQGRRFVEVIERNSRRELSLVGDLLLLTRITAGTFEIEVGRADLADLVSTTAEEAAPEAAKAGVAITLDIDDAPEIDADPHRLGQVLANLVSNAIKFTPRGGQIAIRAAGEGEHAVIAVTDTGIGIPPEDCDHLFERMFRTREVERRHIQGTGLGLTIVKAIVDAHGGSIGVESDLGRGTTFRVELPLVAAPRRTNGGRVHGVEDG